MREEGVHELAERITAGLGLDPVEVDLFDLALEEWWSRELGLAQDLFGEEPTLLCEELTRLQAKLSALECLFAEREEWERCVRTRDLRARAAKEIANFLVQSGIDSAYRGC